MERMRVASLILWLLLWTLPARAEITFGTEFTFSNAELRANFFERGRATDVQKGYLRAVRDNIAAKCPECRITEIKHKNELAFRVELSGGPVAGAYVDLTMDNGVIEIITSPMTLDQHSALKETFRSLVFEQAKRARLDPQPYAGQGHVHIGVKSAFGEDSVLLRNFLVDFYNHPEMGLGVLQDSDPGKNASQIAELSAQTKEAWRKVIREFDHLVASGKTPTIKDFVRMIAGQVLAPAEARGEIDGQRYMGVNILNMLYEPNPDKQTIEVRTLRPTRDAGSHVLILEMLQKRIEYLKGKKKTIPIELPDLFFPEAMARNWEKYLVEMKADVGHFAEILPSSSPCAYYFRRAKTH